MPYPDYRSRFKDLIARVAQAAGQRVVILVDEYDKPILDRIEDPAIALQIREALKDFYSVIKDSDAYVKFAFLTGVSKFSKVSLFSGLNLASGEPIDLIGVEFSKEARNVVAFEVQRVKA